MFDEWKTVVKAMNENNVDGKDDVQPLWMLDRCKNNYRAIVIKIRNRTVTNRYQTSNSESVRNKKDNV
ncbi:hypothetical protein I6N90_00585 [Paenibacillus sp. GSMTC-2017]|uniref:hypothetical protein n=1 Tax=Paenibacillus sp. GSMTC-2017 TaxID=2794350 RepID=UPI0018D6A169|nr:hypothetical protein [Paenibacillus sp. GSMTC-2017]MBH5316303.1 hypothetical protein [Paenibacillus sp. GSMTC-2017]